MNTPEDLKYTRSHEWIRLTANIVTVGITDHAQRELTDVVYFEPPKMGDELEGGRECAVVESVKAASDIYAPVSGKVVEVNSGLAEHPEWINQFPYEKGWMFKLQLKKPDELNELLTAAQYEAHISGK